MTVADAYHRPKKASLWCLHAGRCPDQVIRFDQLRTYQNVKLNPKSGSDRGADLGAEVRSSERGNAVATTQLLGVTFVLSIRLVNEAMEA